MSDLRIIKDILQNRAVVAKKTRFTYIDRLFPEFGENSEILLVSKKIVSPTKVFCQEIPQIQNTEPLEVTGHDVTGSPLRHSFGDDAFNVTIISEKRYWSKDEENHYPLENLQASAIVNQCLESLDENWLLPLFVLCDGSDIQKTVLLGTFVEPKWFTTINISTAGPVGSSKIHDCDSLMKKHLTSSPVPEREVKVAISSIYELRGVRKNTIDWSENERADFEGSLCLELTWDSLSFLPPARTLSNCLTAEIAAGSKTSPLSDLWNQLLLLDRYLTILETYRMKNLSARYSVLPLTFPKDFNTPYIREPEVVLEKLNLLLSGDDDFENDDYRSDRNDGRPFDNDTDLDDNALLRSYLRELSSRQNLDFTDQLWRLIIGSSDYGQMTDCLHAVFEEVVDNHYKPQINGTQPTRLANLLNELNSEKAVVPSLAGSLPLELVIDMGMEKISRDYTYLLLSANLAELHDLREKLSNVSTDEFSTDKYRKRLIFMAQIHICMEFLLIVQNNSDCSFYTSCSFFNYAMKLYTSQESPVKSFADLIDNPIYTLKAPGSNAVLKEVVKVLPSMWRATLSSTHRSRKVTTTTHYSQVPIFPPNIYSPGDPIEEEENFHVTKVISSSYKIR